MTRLNDSQGCPDFGCEDYLDPVCLIVEAHAKHYEIVNLEPGIAYPLGTPLMNGPNGNAIPWDGADAMAIRGAVKGDIDLTLNDEPCPEVILGDGACVNPKAICWPEKLTDEDILKIIQEGKGCLQFRGIWANCHISEPDFPQTETPVKKAAAQKEG